MGIWARAHSLAKNRDSVSLQDALYLRVCIKQNERNLSLAESGVATDLDALLIGYVPA